MPPRSQLGGSGCRRCGSSSSGGGSDEGNGRRVEEAAVVVRDGHSDGQSV